MNILCVTSTNFCWVLRKKRLLLLFALSFLEIYGGLFKSKEDFPYKFNNFSTKKCNQKNGTTFLSAFKCTKSVKKCRCLKSTRTFFHIFYEAKTWLKGQKSSLHILCHCFFFNFYVFVLCVPPLSFAWDKKKGFFVFLEAFVSLL